MRKSKILMVMTAFVLAVVGVLVAVTSVLSAQQQSVTSSLQVTYVASNVKAEIKIESAKVTTAGVIGSYTTAAGGAITSFDVTDSSATQGTVTAPEQTLGMGTTNDDSDTFYRGLIYRFTFTNQYSSGTGCPLRVSAQYTANEYALDNVLCAWGVGTASAVTMPSDGASATWTSPAITGTTAHAFDWLNSKQTIASSVAVNNGTVCLYLVVVIKDTTKSASFKINSSTANTLLFTLEGVTA